MIDVCPFCRQVPVMNRALRETPHSFWVECVSSVCANREVRTHRCGDEKSAEDAWNQRVVEGEEPFVIEIKGKRIELSPSEKIALSTRLSETKNGR